MSKKGTIQFDGDFTWKDYSLTKGNHMYWKTHFSMGKEAWQKGDRLCAFLCTLTGVIMLSRQSESPMMFASGPKRMQRAETGEETHIPQPELDPQYPIHRQNTPQQATQAAGPEQEAGEIESPPQADFGAMSVPQLFEELNKESNLQRGKLSDFLKVAWPIVQALLENMLKG